MNTSVLSYAQNREDVLLARVLEEIDHGFYIDVGSNDPNTLSVTRAFYEKGWNGINIEPSPFYYSRCSQYRPRDINLETALGATAGEAVFYEIEDTGLSTLSKEEADRHREANWKVQTRTVKIERLDRVWEHHVKGPVHFLKIDVEGWEKEVLLGADFQVHRPWVILIESVGPLSTVETHEQWEDILLSQGYNFVHADGLNRFYLAAEHHELTPRFAYPPNPNDGWISATEDELRKEADILRAQRDALLGKTERKWIGPSGPPPSKSAGAVAPPTLSRPTSQLCTSNQFEEYEYRAWCNVLKAPFSFHRKQWGFAYILQSLFSKGMLAPGKRGLGFGCGKEPLPAVMATYGCKVLATDLDPGAAASKGWIGTDQYSKELKDLNEQNLCSDELFQQNVSFRFEDMNEIHDDLHGFDFVWSSCALEHLGSIRHGLDFILKAQQCLKPGGISIHVTEFNLSSNNETYETSNLSLFRAYDIESLITRLQAKGDHVEPLNVHPGSHPLDFYLDTPPWDSAPHIRIGVGRFVITSLGIIIEKSSMSTNSPQS
jgi:FkbM family methyltransferase